MKEPRRQVYLQSVGLSFRHHGRCWPTYILCRVSFSLLNVTSHTLISQCTCLYDVQVWYTQCRPTHPINVGPASQSIPVSMTVNCIQCWPILKHNWVIVRDCSDCHTGALTLYSPKGHYPDNTIHWPNCEIMLGHCFHLAPSRLTVGPLV